ncbi:MAG: tetratricopeptide repeat protein [Chitinispirillia bacterium]|nr:tetratricopeptide repeat protein [Chitinispirillia bacterium]
MDRCSKCGVIVSEGAEFCSGCGKFCGIFATSERVTVENLSLWGYFVKCITKIFFKGKGRARRKEFWGFCLFDVLTVFLLVAVLPTVFKDNVSNLLFSLAGITLQVSFRAVLSRRLHDIGKSSWWIMYFPATVFVGLMLMMFFLPPRVIFGFSVMYNIDIKTATIMLIYILTIIAMIPFFAWLCRDSQPGENEYGPNPKGINDDNVSNKKDKSIAVASAIALLLITVGWVAIPNSAKNAITHYNKGIELFNKGRLDEAIREFNQAIRLDPNSAEMYYNRGKIYLRVDFDMAIADFDQALRLNASFDAAYNNRGLAYFNKGDIDMAIADFDQALRLNPNCDIAYSNRGNVYFYKDDFDMAIADYDQALRLNPISVETYFSRGNVYVLKGDFDMAIADYDQTLLLNPVFGEAYFSRGLAYSNKGDFDMAITNFETALQINPNHAYAKDKLELARQKRGR